MILFPPPHKGPDPASRRKRRLRVKTTSGPGRPSRRSSSTGWKRSSRTTTTLPSSGGRAWRGTLALTSLRSKSGFRTNGPKSKNPPGIKTLLHCIWWRRDCTTTPQPRTGARTASRTHRGGNKTTKKPAGVYMLSQRRWCDIYVSYVCMCKRVCVQTMHVQTGLQFQRCPIQVKDGAAFCGTEELGWEYADGPTVLIRTGSDSDP